MNNTCILCPQFFDWYSVREKVSNSIFIFRAISLTSVGKPPCFFYTFYLVYIWHCRIKLFLRHLPNCPCSNFLYQSKNCGHRIHVLFMMYDVYWYCQMKKNEWLWKFWKRGEEETKSMPHAPVVRRHFHSPCPRYTNLWVVLPILDVHCCWVLILYF
jgi:hypothetical protein